MGCGCGLVGTLIIDVGTGAERRSSPQRRPGLSTVFSIEVTEADAIDDLKVSIMHKDKTDTSWTEAGTFASITSAGVYTKHLTGLKEDIYWRFKCDDGRYVINAMNAQGLDG